MEPPSFAVLHGALVHSPPGKVCTFWPLPLCSVAGVLSDSDEIACEIVEEEEEEEEEGEQQ